MESSAAAARRMPDALQHCAPDSVASALLLDGGGRFEEVGNVAVTEDGEFVMWAGLKLPLGSAAGETATQHSKLQHALLKLIRGPSWDNRNYSSQTIVAALNMASATMIRQGNLASAETLLARAEVLLRDARKRTETHAGAHEIEGMQRLQAVTLNNSACAHRRAGRLEQAMHCLHEALSVDATLQGQARAQRCADGAVGGAGGKIGGNASALLLNLSTILAVLGRWDEAKLRAQEAIECVWSFETHWQSPQERMYAAVAAYHNMALAQRALGEHEPATLSMSLSLSASKHFFGGEGSLSKLVYASTARFPAPIPHLEYNEWFSACAELQKRRGSSQTRENVQEHSDTFGQERANVGQESAGVGAAAADHMCEEPRGGLGTNLQNLAEREPAACEVQGVEAGGKEAEEAEVAAEAEPPAHTPGGARICQVVLAREAASAIQESDAKNRVMSLPSTHRANAANELGPERWRNLTWTQRLLAMEEYLAMQDEASSSQSNDAAVCEMHHGELEAEEVFLHGASDGAVADPNAHDDEVTEVTEGNANMMLKGGEGRMDVEPPAAEKPGMDVQPLLLAAHLVREEAAAYLLAQEGHGCQEPDVCAGEQKARGLVEQIGRDERASEGGETGGDEIAKNLTYCDAYDTASFADDSEEGGTLSSSQPESIFPDGEEEDAESEGSQEVDGEEEIVHNGVKMSSETVLRDAGADGVEGTTSPTFAVTGGLMVPAPPGKPAVMVETEGGRSQGVRAGSPSTNTGEGGGGRGSRPPRRWIVDAHQGTRWDLMPQLLDGMQSGVLEPSTGYNDVEHDNGQDRAAGRSDAACKASDGMHLPATPTGARMSAANRNISRVRETQFSKDALTGHSRDARRVFLRAQGFVTPKTKERVGEWLRVHVPVREQEKGGLRSFELSPANANLEVPDENDVSYDEEEACALSQEGGYRSEKHEEERDELLPLKSHEDKENVFGNGRSAGRSRTVSSAGDVHIGIIPFGQRLQNSSADSGFAHEVMRKSQMVKEVGGRVKFWHTCEEDLGMHGAWTEVCNNDAGEEDEWWDSNHNSGDGDAQECNLSAGEGSGTQDEVLQGPSSHEQGAKNVELTAERCEDSCFGWSRTVVGKRLACPAPLSPSLVFESSFQPKTAPSEVPGGGERCAARDEASPDIPVSSGSEASHKSTRSSGERRRQREHSAEADSSHGMENTSFSGRSDFKRVRVRSTEREAYLGCEQDYIKASEADAGGSGGNTTTENVDDSAAHLCKQNGAFDERRRFGSGCGASGQREQADADPSQVGSSSLMPPADVAKSERIRPGMTLMVKQPVEMTPTRPLTPRRGHRQKGPAPSSDWGSPTSPDSDAMPRSHCHSEVR